jgi:ring-1,2-phenylacetyl-CoA epoxidase subunit PaaD
MQNGNSKMINTQFNEKAIWQLLESIPDPEVPAISIVELGVVRAVRVFEDQVEVDITPTYSGCPALKTMEEDIRKILNAEGLKVVIKTIFKPAWTTDWMSDEAKQKLKEYGIAPPEKLTFEHLLPLGNPNNNPIPCPFCDSKNTKLTSQFGSTACKALYFCDNCHQPFEHFKCH